MYQSGNLASFKAFSGLFTFSSLFRLVRITLLCFALGSLSVGCTENEDDTQCGTPEWPCDEVIVTDDMVEV